MGFCAPAALRSPIVTTSTGRPPEVDRWRLATERLLFAAPAAVGVGVVAAGVASQPGGPMSLGVVVSWAARRPLLTVAGLVAVVVLGLGWTVAVAAAIYLDAAAVEADGSGWDPRGTMYASLALVVPVAVIAYLRRRYRHASPDPPGHWWWLGVPLATVALVGTVATVWLGIAPPVAVFAGAGTAVALLPVAAYRDAAHVRSFDGDWRPDPALQFVLAAVATLLVFPQPGYATYYLWRRRRAGRPG